MFRLGLTGFGGPVALTAAMQSELVDKKNIVSEAEFKKGLFLSQICPGPQATQLAMYLGWLFNGWWGAALTGFLLALPSFVIVVLLAEYYLRNGNSSEAQLFFKGTIPVVAAIIALSIHKMSNRFIHRNILLWCVACNALLLNFFEVIPLWQNILIFSFLSMFVMPLYKFFEKKINLHSYYIFFGSLMTVVVIGVVLVFSTKFYQMKKNWIGLQDSNSEQIEILKKSGAKHADTKKVELTHWEIFSYFGEVGSFVIGSGLSIIPYIHEGLVKEKKWLTEQQFVDSIAVAMLSPGPLVITVAFIGYLLLGIGGALLAALGIFLPPYVFTILLAPMMNVLEKNKSLKESFDYSVATVIGCLAGTLIEVFWGLLKSPINLGVFLMSIFLIIKFFQNREFILILLSGIIAIYAGV